MGAIMGSVVRILRVGVWCMAMGLAFCSVVCVALIGHFVVLVAFASAHNEAPRGARAVLAYLFGLAVTAWLALSAHEGGHLLAARVCGLVPRSARIGPVTLLRVGSGWQAGWVWRCNWFSGEAVCPGAPGC